MLQPILIWFWPNFDPKLFWTQKINIFAPIFLDTVFFNPKFFWFLSFLAKKSFVPKILSDPKFVCIQKFLGPKIYWTQTFLENTYFDQKILLDPNVFGPKFFCAQNIFAPTFSTQTLFGPWSLLPFWSRIFSCDGQLKKWRCHSFR